MTRKRRRRLTLVFAVALVLFGTTLLNLATNLVSALPRLPGWIDIVRMHPLWVFVIATLLLIPATYFYVRQGSGEEPESVSRADLGELRHDLTSDFGRIFSTGDEKLLERLPPYAQLAFRESGSSSAQIWKLIVPFTEEHADPARLAAEWAASLPPEVGELPATGRLTLGEIFVSYGQHSAALNEFKQALKLGATPRVYWLVRSIQITWRNEEQESANELLAEAMSVDPNYPLVKAFEIYSKNRANDAADVLVDWEPYGERELDARSLFLGGLYFEVGQLDDAIQSLEQRSDVTRNPALLLELSKMLRVRSLQGGGDSRWKDAFRAIELARRARNLRRSWRGDSPEAVAIAVECALTADDPEQAWKIASSEPDGEARPAEATDARVLPVAGAAAALTGRRSQALRLSQSVPDGYARRVIEAEIAGAGANNSSREASEAWNHAYLAASSVGQKLEALRGLAMTGVMDHEALEALRPEQPSAVAEIHTAFKIASVTGAGAQEVLREMEPTNMLASVRRAELLRIENPQLAVEVLIDATARWNDPRLMLLALDCYIDSGLWREAESFGRKALSEAGTLWPGRTTILRRMLQIQNSLKYWTSAISTSRALLEVDPYDQDARLHLAFAQYRNGDTLEAWQTIQRSSMPFVASNQQQAAFLLDLARRYADGVSLGRLVIEILESFPSDETVHNAAINAITLRPEGVEIPKEIDARIFEAFATFRARFPDHEAYTEIKIATDSDDPLSGFEPDLRQQYMNYGKVIDLVRDNLAPLGCLTWVVNKPYAALFTYQPLGFHRVATISSQDIAIEGEMTRSISERPCFIDSSALYTLSLLHEYSRTLVGLALRPTVTGETVRDLAEAEDLFSVIPSGHVEFDPESGRVIARAADEAGILMQQSRVVEMLELGRGLRRVVHPEVIHVPSLSVEQEPVWLLAIDAAKEHDAVLWADDLGVRRLAHISGVRTFGTLSLLNFARELDVLTNDQVEQITRSLISGNVVDLPFNQSALLAVAEQQEWMPIAVAMVLSRPPSWANFEAAMLILCSALRHAPADMCETWAYAGFSGLYAAVQDDRRTDALVTALTVVFTKRQTRPEHAAAAVGALKKVATDDAESILKSTLEGVWAQLREAYRIEESVMIFTYIVSGLESSDRVLAMQIVLELK